MDFFVGWAIIAALEWVRKIFVFLLSLQAIRASFIQVKPLVAESLSFQFSFRQLTSVPQEAIKLLKRLFFKKETAN